MGLIGTTAGKGGKGGLLPWKEKKECDGTAGGGTGPTRPRLWRKFCGMRELGGLLRPCTARKSRVFGRDTAMHKRIRMRGAGCVRADRYGTFEIGGRELQPLLAEALRESCGGREGDLCLAGRLTLTLEIWEEPLTVQGGASRQEGRT